MNPSLPIRIVVSLISAAGVAAAVTLLFLGMRAVLTVGGFCARGGPYEISVACPPSVDWLLPLSIFAGLGFTFLFIWFSPPEVRGFVVFAWTGVFVALGWNFLDFGLGWHGSSTSIIWLVLGVCSILLGLAPVIPALQRVNRRGPKTTQATPVTEGKGGRPPMGHGGDEPAALSAGKAHALERISAMHDAGELTDREFAATKRELLGETADSPEPVLGAPRARKWLSGGLAIAVVVGVGLGSIFFAAMTG